VGLQILRPKRCAVLGKLTSLFYESDATKAPEQPKDTPKAKETPTPKPVVIPPSIPGQVDPEMVKILEDAIQEANIPGFDYIEFRDVLGNMASLGLPEQKLFQAAFASAQIAKVTKIQLLEAITFYLKVIETKAQEFTEYVAGLEATDVSGKDHKIAELEKLIENDALQIQQLTTSIGERRQKQDALRMEKAQADLDIKNKTAAFEATKATIINKLNSDQNKINTYIQ
jgi:hypothetical protein